MSKKTKKELIADFLELGGSPGDVNDRMTNEEIQDKIEALKVARELQQQLEGTQEPGTPEEPKVEEQAPPEPTPPETTPADTDGGDEEKQGYEETFVLTQAKTYSTMRLPGKKYTAGVKFTTEDEEEIKVLKASGMFRVIEG